MTAPAPAVERAAAEDLPAIAAIYNEAVLTTAATFDVEPKTLEELRVWLDEHAGRHPVLVARLGGEVVGWAALSRWSNRWAYSDAAELSVYVASGARGRGIGRLLVEAVLREGRRAGFHTVLARVTAESEASLRLHRRAGFATVGIMRQMGRKFGRLLDVVLMQMIFEDDPPK